MPEQATDLRTSKNNGEWSWEKPTQGALEPVDRPQEVVSAQGKSALAGPPGGPRVRREKPGHSTGHTCVHTRTCTQAHMLCSPSTDPHPLLLLLLLPSCPGRASPPWMVGRTCIFLSPFLYQVLQEGLFSSSDRTAEPYYVLGTWEGTWKEREEEEKRETMQEGGRWAHRQEGRNDEQQCGHGTVFTEE